MKRTYEAMVLLDNREVKQGWQALKDTVIGLFTKHGADIKSARRWDERRLAYPIERQLRGTYLLIYFEAETSELALMRRELEYAEAVLRHLTHVCEEIPADAYDPEEEFDEESVRVESQGDPVVAEQSDDDADDSGESSKAGASDDDAGGDDAGGDDAGGDDAGGDDAGGDDAGGDDAGGGDAGGDDAEGGDAGGDDTGGDDSDDDKKKED